MKGAFRARFAYDWVLYVAVAVFSVMLWYFAFSLFNAPAPTETVQIFFGGTVKDYSFRTVAKDYMSDYGVKAVEINSCNLEDSAFAAKYSTVALNGCDVIIVPESIADETECENTFAVTEGFENAYERDGVAYGVYLSGEVKENLSEYFVFGNEEYVAFIAASSPNSGGDAPTDTAVVFLKWLNGYVKDQKTT